MTGHFVAPTTINMGLDLSQRDVQLLTSLNLSFSDVASAVNITRQTVSKSVKDVETDFFNQSKLIQLHDWIMRNGNFDVRVYERMASKLFPEVEGIISDQDRLPRRGEFWFLYKNYIDFAARYPQCFEEFKEVAKREDATLVIFTSTAREVKDFEEALKGMGVENTFLYPCELTLQLQIPTFVHKSNSGEIRSFVGGKNGFAEAGGPDAANLRFILGGYIN